MGTPGADQRNALVMALVAVAVFGLFGTLLARPGSDGSGAAGDPTAGTTVAPSADADADDPDVAGAGDDPSAGAATGTAPEAGTTAEPAGGAPSAPTAGPATPAPAAPASGPAAAPSWPEDDGVNDGATDVGVTAGLVTIGVVADVSGAAPSEEGRAAIEAMEAFAAWANEEVGPIQGRELRVRSWDGRADAGSQRQAYREACEQAFALVGTWLWEGRAAAQFADQCGIVDLRAQTTTPQERLHEVFAVKAFRSTQPSLASWTRWAEREPEAVANAAWVQLGSWSGGEHREAVEESTRRLGYRWREDPAEPLGGLAGWGALVDDLAEDGVEFLHLDGNPVDVVRFAQTMRRQGYEPKLVTLAEPLYGDPMLARDRALWGAEVATDMVPFEEVEAQPVLTRYRTWLERVHPAATPSVAGARAWAAGEAFLDALRHLGDAPTREDLADHLRARDDWSLGGLLAPRPLFGEVAADCVAVLRLDEGAWVRTRPGTPGRLPC